MSNTDGPLTETGLRRIVEQIRPRPPAPRFDLFRVSVVVMLAVLGGDHTGIWDVDGVFSGGGWTVQEVVMVLSTITALYAAITKKRSH